VSDFSGDPHRNEIGLEEFPCCLWPEPTRLDRADTDLLSAARTHQGGEEHGVIAAVSGGLAMRELAAGVPSCE
jgi:hypothetical protein